MPRRAKPWYKASHRAWYTKIKGEQIRLGETEAEAWKEFHRLMASVDGTPAPRPGSGRAKLVDVLDAWLIAKAKQGVKPPTMRIARTFAQSLVKFVPYGLKASDVRPSTIADWLDANPGWNQTTRAMGIRRIKTAYRWATAEEWIPKDPLANMKVPAELVREPAGAGVLDPVLNAVSPGARDILLFMLHTGARPGEAVSVEASGLNFKQGTAAVEGKMGPKVIVVPSAFLPRLRELAKLRPEGKLFRNARGTPWDPHTIVNQVRRAKIRLGLTGYLVPYHLRGIFASGRIAAGVGDSLVGKMLGHSKPYTLHKHYHNPEHDTLREAVDRPPAPRKKKARPKPGK